MLEAWQQASENLEKVLPESEFSTWIKPVRYNHKENDTVYLSVPTLFIKEWLQQEHYIKMLSGAMSVTTGGNVLVDFVVRESEAEPEPVMPEYLMMKGHPEQENINNFSTDYTFTPLNSKYTFELFVSGTGNQFAHAAAMAVANNSPDTYNPLFIYGGVGLGKSHLLNAIGHQIRKNSPEKNVCYCSAEKFMYEMVNHIRMQKMDAFRNLSGVLTSFLLMTYSSSQKKPEPRKSFSIHSMRCMRLTNR